MFIVNRRVYQAEHVLRTSMVTVCTIWISIQCAIKLIIGNLSIGFVILSLCWTANKLWFRYNDNVTIKWTACLINILKHYLFTMSLKSIQIKNKNVNVYIGHHFKQNEILCVCCETSIIVATSIIISPTHRNMRQNCAM